MGVSTDYYSSIKNLINQKMILNATRSTQSIAYTPTIGVGETTVYEVVPPAGTTQMINNFSIDLTNMALTDVLTIRLYKKIVSGGAYLLSSIDATYTFINAVAVGLPVCQSMFKNEFNTYGVKIVIVQSAGTAKAFQTEVMNSLPVA